jgi:hypothetical protein
MTVAELRSFIFLDQLQPQTMCYLGSWIRGRLPRAGMAAQVIEVARPGHRAAHRLRGEGADVRKHPGR